RAPSRSERRANARTREQGVIHNHHREIAHACFGVLTVKDRSVMKFVRPTKVIRGSFTDGAEDAHAARIRAPHGLRPGARAPRKRVRAAFWRKLQDRRRRVSSACRIPRSLRSSCVPWSRFTRRSRVVRSERKTTHSEAFFGCAPSAQGLLG